MAGHNTMKSKIIVSIANQKGGVGKTTTSINLSAGLAINGKKTLLVDLDPQGNSSISLLDLQNVKEGAYEFLTESGKDWQTFVYQTNYENLDVIPAKINLAKLEAKLVGDFDSIFRLKDRIEQLISNYDVVIFDTPPTLGLTTVNALVASTHVIIPIQSSYFALEGTGDLLETIEKVRSRPNPDLQLLGVLVTLYDKRTALSKDVEAHIRKVFGEKAFNVNITRSVRLEESPAHKETIFTYAPTSNSAKEYQQLCEEVLNRVK
jgi:chromosome partitioning protein